MKVTPLKGVLGGARREDGQEVVHLGVAGKPLVGGRYGLMRHFVADPVSHPPYHFLRGLIELRAKLGVQRPRVASLVVIKPVSHGGLRW
ncbi:hypothetical protein JJ691_87780 [Kutzneria sp. CA-103260]|nr:hypothetical protein JJ691_87780 [Kutzneria sp. CA-103260]